MPPFMGFIALWKEENTMTSSSERYEVSVDCVGTAAPTKWSTCFKCTFMTQCNSFSVINPFKSPLYYMANEKILSGIKKSAQKNHALSPWIPWTESWLCL
jgi:hypothetical protein